MSEKRWSVSAEEAWRLLTEPMDRQEAMAAADAVTVALPHVHATPVDPQRNLLLAWDRWGVEMLVEALELSANSGRPVPPGVIADMRQWLDRAESYEPDAPRWPSQ